MLRSCSTVLACLVVSCFQLSAQTWAPVEEMELVDSRGSSLGKVDPSTGKVYLDVLGEVMPFGFSRNRLVPNGESFKWMREGIFFDEPGCQGQPFFRLRTSYDLDNLPDFEPGVDCGIPCILALAELPGINSLRERLFPWAWTSANDVEQKLWVEDVDSEVYLGTVDEIQSQLVYEPVPPYILPWNIQEFCRNADEIFGSPGEALQAHKEFPWTLRVIHTINLGDEFVPPFRMRAVSDGGGFNPGPPSTPPGLIK